MVALSTRARIGHNLDDALGLAFGLRAVVLGEMPAQDVDLHVLVARFVFGQADMGEFGVGVGNPGNGAVIGACGHTKQRIPDDDAGMIARDMRELETACDVADGEDSPVGGAEPVVELQTALGIFDAGLLQIEPLDIGAAAGRNKDMRARYFPFAFPVRDGDGDPALTAGDG